MVSVAGKLLMAWLRVTRRKEMFRDTTKFDRSVYQSQRARSAPPPKSVRRRHAVQRFDVHGFPCYTIAPRNGDRDGKQVLYLHGGAYVHSIEHEHWTFLGRLVSALGCHVTVPLYPLAPRYQYDETLAMINAVYDTALAGTPTPQQVVMGDSAGGGLALVLARRLKAEGKPAPANLVLISPWLDLTMTDPAVPILDYRDPYLSTPGLLEAARYYTGELDLRDERVSPLNGELDGLGRISVFTGTRDVLLRDSRRLYANAEQANIPIDYFEYPGMIHGWVLMPLPEGRRALRQITELLQQRP